MICNEASGRHTLPVRVGLFLVFLFGVSPAVAQIEYQSAAIHRQELKYGLQEAREVESVYKETHLNLDNRNFKKGEAARKQEKPKGEYNYYRFTDNNNAVLRSNRKKYFKSKNKN